FIRQAVRGEEIQLFGDGQQKRDFDYVDDVADALLRAGAMEAADGEVFSLGGEAPVALIDIAKMLVELAGRGGSYRLVAFPRHRQKNDLRDLHADAANIRKALRWEPAVALRGGRGTTP